MSSAAAASGDPGRPFIALWRRYDTRRTEQLARLKGLELQAGDDYGQRAWEQAKLLWQNLPAGVRIDLPSPRAFGRVLGLFRTCVTLKRDKIARLELSADEIAGLVGYSKATVEAVLRWLGCEAIEYDGAQVSRGLGVLHRGRRTGAALVDGVKKFVYRTSRIVLTMIGRALLGLGVIEREDKASRETAAPPSAPPDPVPDAPPATASPEVGASWLERIKKQLQ